MDKYRMLSKKGEGTFSEVLKCQNTKDGTYWACKKMKHHYTSVEEVKGIREIQALRHLSSCPHILKLHEVIFERRSGTLNLIFELMDMNLYELIRSQRSYFSNERIASFMFQLLKAVEHMHKFGYFHRDIKPENILVKGDLLKLADFGSVRKINTAHPYTEYISTRWYRAPECLLTDGFYAHPMDVWSVGCVMFEIITLHPLFPGSNEIDQIDKIHDVVGTPDPSLLEKFRQQSRNIRFAFKPKKGIGINRYLPNQARECVELVTLLCTYDPDKRISAHRALKHRYFDIIKEISNGSNKENELELEPSEEGDEDIQSKLSSEENSVSGTQRVEVEATNSASNELFKPILKRKKFNVKQYNKNNSNGTMNKGTSLSALNQTNSTSLSVLSNYSDSNPITSATVANNQQQQASINNNNPPSYSNAYKYALSKKNIMFNPSGAQITLPKLSNSTNSVYNHHYNSYFGYPAVHGHGLVAAQQQQPQSYAQYQQQHQQQQPVYAHPSPSSSSLHNVLSKINTNNTGLPSLYTSSTGHHSGLIENKIIGASKIHYKYT